MNGRTPERRRSGALFPDIPPAGAPSQDGAAMGRPHHRFIRALSSVSQFSTTTTVAEFTFVALRARAMMKRPSRATSHGVEYAYSTWSRSSAIWKSGAGAVTFRDVP